MQSREASKIPFINDLPLERLLGAKLPISRDVFRLFWHHHKKIGQTCSVAIRETAKAVSEFWKDAGIVPKKIDCIVKNVQKLVDSYKVK